VRIRNPDAESPIHLDFVPMVDVLFNLLIFFLLATSLKQAEREMHIALPVAKASGPISAALREIVVNVDAGGAIIVGAKRIEPEDLHAMVQEAVKANPEQKVTVRADRTTAYENVVRVLDICKGSGVQQPYLDTIVLGS
jgi:biopolymer transport protein ExbD